MLFVSKKNWNSPPLSWAWSLRGSILRLRIPSPSDAFRPFGPPVPDPHRYGELVPGTSTRDEAVAKLGPPQGKTDSRGNILLRWFDYNAAHPMRVAILFGPDSHMIKVTEVLDQ